MELDDNQLLRYSRQIMLPEVDYQGQLQLCASRALIIGLGGLGSPAALYLAAAGVGQLALSDDDQVELSNLQRQILHSTNDLQRGKADSARRRISALNPEIKVFPRAERLSDAELESEIALADVVLDCSDNFSTRFTLNRLCVLQKTPLVSGAAIRMQGQLSVFDNRGDQSACYRCLFTDESESNESCSESGVFTPLVGIIGSFQAAEALKVLLGIGRNLNGRLLTLDLLNAVWREIKIRKDPNCPVCSLNHN